MKKTWAIYNSKLENWQGDNRGLKFHAVLCDPPYSLEFMGKLWDKGAEYKAWGEAILVPFSGSGSEMIGCLAAGWDNIVGIESDTKKVTST